MLHIDITLPLAFLKKLSLIKSSTFKLSPVTGFVFSFSKCFVIFLKQIRHDFQVIIPNTYVKSNIMPSLVQTGCSKGRSESAQQSNGKRRNSDEVGFLRAPPNEVPPYLLLHSLCVI
jgi:hypothetical protein